MFVLIFLNEKQMNDFKILFGENESLVDTLTENLKSKKSGCQKSEGT